MAVTDKHDAAVDPRRNPLGDQPGAPLTTIGTAAPSVHHPAVARELVRAEELQVRIADLITRFAGSMGFVYAHVVLFLGWMLILERSPWPTLTLVVSLEAIFLSTFVMIGQNRQAAFQRAKADHDFVSEGHELRTNTEMTRCIEALVQEIHDTVRAGDGPKS